VQPSDPAGPEPIGRSLGRAHKLVRLWGDRMLAPIGATVTDYILLVQVQAAPAPGLSQTQLARFSDMGGPALVRHLDRLEADGVLRRSRDGRDRRVVRVHLTAAGRRRLQQLAAVMERTDQELRAQLTTREQDVLQRACSKLFTFARDQLAEGTADDLEPGGAA
jgi:DNA-binding MarR family transcriptional regulator